LPLAELIGIAYRAVVKAVAGDASATDWAVDTMHGRLVIIVDNARVKCIGNALSPCDVAAYDGITDRSITFCNSRILPGHGYD
jgi:hypothetical protein